jgi:hypothetical protein
MPAAQPAPAPAPAPAAPPSLAERNFPEKAAAAARADWYVFVLQELNGLGTMLRFQEDPKGAPAKEIGGRIRAVLDTLAWDAPAALAETWAFVENHLNEPDDAWGPSLVLRAIEPDKKKVQSWFEGLKPEARAVIETTPVAAGG